MLGNSIPINFLAVSTITCTDLTAPANGMIGYNVATSLTPWPENTVATYTCVTGYMLDGDMTRTCEATGSWSGSDTTCESTLFVAYTVSILSAVVTCPPLTNPDKGMVSVPNNNFESTATYTCVPGYTVSGGDMPRTCEATMMWSGAAPTCECESIQCGYSECYIIVCVCGICCSDLSRPHCTNQWSTTCVQ